MIQRIHIQNYRTFKKLDVELKDGLNIIVGNNETSLTSDYPLELRTSLIDGCTIRFTRLCIGILGTVSTIWEKVALMDAKHNGYIYPITVVFYVEGYY